VSASAIGRSQDEYKTTHSSWSDTDTQGQLSTDVWEPPGCPSEEALGPLPVCSDQQVKNRSHDTVLVEFS
jgi:hypothetical protein